MKITKEDEAKILSRIDQDVLVRVNAWGEEVYNEYYDCGSGHLYEMYMPSMYFDEDNENYEDDVYPEPMQYWIICEWLAKQMLNDDGRRDPVMETSDGLFIWVRCGCGYALYDDLVKYYLD
jgi:hypothetical protein